MSQPTSADPRPEPLPQADGPALPMPSWPQGVDLPEDLTQIVARWQRAESDLQAQTVLLRTVLDESPDFIILKDHEGNFLLCNRPVAQFYGTTPEAMVGKHDGDFGCPPEMAEAFRRSVLEVMAHGRTEVVLEESRDAGSGETRWFRSIKKPFAGPDGRMRILVIAHDITDVQQAQLRLEASERRLQYALEARGDGVWDWDIASGRLTLSRRWCQMFGYAPDELTGTLGDFLRCLDEQTRPEVDTALAACLEGDGRWEHEHAMCTKDGRQLWVLDRGQVVERDAQGRPLRMVGAISDISDQKRTRELIWQQANHDSLTGLPNRNRLYDRLHEEMAASDRSGLPLAMLMLDIDGFKEVNDSLGHAWGDALLQEAAGRLRACVREGDTVARLGGDEFVLLLGAVTDLRAVSRIAQDVLAAIQRPFRLGDDLVYVTASVGITQYPQDAADLGSLLRGADQAMYAAKRQGRNRFDHFTPALERQAQERARTLADLRLALKEGQFELHFQPIVDLRSGEVRKAEALLRWRHPTRGMVSPAEFIPLAESSGLIHALGDWVFREATRLVAGWRQTVHAQFQVAVNVSPLQFQNPELDLEAWLAHLRQLGLDGSAVVVEITEGLLMEAGPEVTRHLLHLRDAGVQVALDDFGTGYSSLSYLNKLDIDYIKIDRSFVCNLQAESPELALCEGITAMAHKLGLRVVAEGVETKEQLQLLKSAGCDHAQGYLISRPVPATAFDRLAAPVAGLAVIA